MRWLDQQRAQLNIRSKSLLSIGILVAYKYQAILESGIISAGLNIRHSNPVINFGSIDLNRITSMEL
jgi:hypothetical protein